MIFVIILIIATITAFGMLSYQVWEIKNGKEVFVRENLILYQTKSFKNIEKNILIFLKYFFQKIFLFFMKFWFLILIKIKKIWTNKKPKLQAIFNKKNSALKNKANPSFVSRALKESKYKVKRMKQKLNKEHEVEL